MKLRSQLSLAFALIVLLTVVPISLLSNIFTNNEFKKYVTKQNEKRTQEIITSLSTQYNSKEMRWNLDFVHAIGMYSLYDGYIVKVADISGAVLWDAEECDMTACMQVMNDISQRMQTKYPQINGEFTNRDFALLQNGTPIGTVNISYFGPYFFNDNDFHFLDSLNTVLISIGISCLLLSFLIGLIMSKRISSPMSKVAEAARKMSDGDYNARIDAKTGTTELGELVGSVNLLAQSLNLQEALRKQLTADVAHELRTPITSVQTHLEAMIEGIWEVTPERLVGCHEEITRIGTLVKDLEGLAKVESEKIKLDKSPVMISHIFDKAINNLAIDIENKNLSVNLDGYAPELMADEDRLYQVAVNLLSNAIKYTPQGGHIQIAFSQEENHAAFTIADNGIGIPENELPFIFERFYRADKSRNRKTGGSGIGLAVVKAIVEAHNGSVEVQSSLGNGSCFRVMLPLYSAIPDPGNPG